MKIIGSNGYSYIVEVSKAEIDELSGRDNHRNDYGHRGAFMSAGTELTISQTWQLMRRLNAERDSVERAAKLLRGQADTLLSLLLPIVTEAVPSIDAPVVQS